MFRVFLKFQNSCSKIAVVMSIIFFRHHINIRAKTIGTAIYARAYTLYCIIHQYLRLTYDGIISKKSPDHPVSLVADVTTLRRHMQSNHKVCSLQPFVSIRKINKDAVLFFLGNIPEMGRDEPLPIDVAKRCRETPE
jgi:hypothetical protein